MYNQQQNPLGIDQNDLNNFKTYTLIFALSTIGSVLGNFIYPGLEYLSTILGYLFLGFAVYSLSKKYPNLESGMKTFYLIILTVVLEAIVAVVDITYPQPSTSQITTTQDAINVINQYLSHLFLILFLNILLSILIFILAYYFTHWFNENVSQYNQTQAFLYYGILYAVGNIVTSIGLYNFFNALSGVDLNSSNANQQLSSALGSAILLLIGSLLLIVALITGIVAGFKIYNRANDLATGKMYYQGQQPYAQQQYGQQPYAQQQYGQQQPNQQAPNQQSVNTNKGVSVCQNCGAELAPGVSFCQNCGTRVS